MSSKLKHARLVANLSLQELSDKIDMPVQLLGNIEYGLRPISFKSVPKLAEALGLTVTEVARWALEGSPDYRKYRDLVLSSRRAQPTKTTLISLVKK